MKKRRKAEEERTSLQDREDNLTKGMDKEQRERIKKERARALVGRRTKRDSPRRERREERKKERKKF